MIFLRLRQLLLVLPSVIIAEGQAAPAPDREPDLTLTAEAAWTLSPQGERQFRSFVIPVGVNEPRFVEAVRLRPGSIGYVRHGVIRMDSTSASRRLDAETDAVGIPGRVLLNSVRQPEGIVAVWTPTEKVSTTPAGTAWRIHPFTDLVVTLHLYPDGMERAILPSVDLWFAKAEPRQQLLTARLADETLDIGPNETRSVSDFIVLSAPLWVGGLYFDANQLATSFNLECTAPESLTVRLGRLKSWQPASAEHRWIEMEERLRVPAAARFDLKVDFANTKALPGVPPVLVNWGPNPNDEVAEAYLQFIVHNEATAIRASRDIALHEIALAVAAAEAKLSREGDRVETHTRLALLYADLGRGETAAAHGEKAIELGPENSEAYGALAAANLVLGRHFTAQENAEKAVDLDQSNANAWFNLGNIFLHYEIPVRARNCFQNAHDLDPREVRFLNNLATLLIDAKDYKEAQKHLETVLVIDPRHARATANLARVHERTADPELAIKLYRRTLELAPELATTVGPRLEKLTGNR